MVDERSPLLSEPQPSTSTQYTGLHHDGPSVQIKEETPRISRCCCIFLTILVVGILVAATTVLVILLIVVGGQPPRVMTSCGQIEGKYDLTENVFSFKGIPYAAPPIGKRRWQSPELLSKKSKTCWTGIYKALSYRSQCLQKHPISGKLSGSEDCLFMNIFTPKLAGPGVSLSVMVYIHGGYELQTGNASADGLTPYPKLAKLLNMVIVSVQYRLNALGFLTLDQLGTNVGNYGLQDQILALRWIKQNIQKFGGNPNKVTIFGQGSGATCITALMTCAQAKGLFHRVWLMSPSPLLNTNITSAIHQNQFFLKKTGAKTKKDLYALSGAQIVNATYTEWHFSEAMDLPTQNNFPSALLVIDGKILAQSPYAVWTKKEQGTFSDIPVVIGSTANEIDMNPLPGEAIKTWTESQFNNSVGKKLNTFSENITLQSLTFYPYSKGPENSYTSMASDIRVNCGLNILAQQMSSAMKSSVFRYIITAAPSSPVTFSDSSFSAQMSFSRYDLIAFLGTLGKFMADEPSSKDSKFGSNMKKIIKQFVDSGNPGVPNWQPFPLSTSLISDKTNIIRKIYHATFCDYYNDHSFQDYSWKN